MLIFHFGARMHSSMLAIQYLEASPGIASLDKSFVVDKLRAAADVLPITHLLIGWHLPQPLLEACRLEAERLGMRFLLWQPLLTSDNTFHHDPAWRTQNLIGDKVAGYRGLDEFTFTCPNHPAMQAALSSHLDDLIHQGIYQGFFLDRVRFPSPAPDLINNLACFCEYCHAKAADYGLDLGQIKADILRSLQHDQGCLSVVRSLLSSITDPVISEVDPVIYQFLDFRKKCLQEFLGKIIQPFRERHLEIGIDCFSPSLTTMVGQNLGSLCKYADWIKLMTYAHTNAPAGLPYELIGLLRFLMKATHFSERQAIDWMAKSVQLPLPANRESLEEYGLTSTALGQEILRGVEACPIPVLAGIELVDLKGVTHLNPGQIHSDLAAAKHARPAGLAISWDLLHIPLSNLHLVKRFYIDVN